MALNRVDLPTFGKPTIPIDKLIGIIIAMNEFLVTVFLFVIGAGVGSFVSMAVHRIRKKQRLTGRSQCDKCKHKIGGLEIIPIVGWLFCRGRCRKCENPIGVESLLTELATACFFAASYLGWSLVGFNTAVGWVLFGLWLIILSGLMFLLVYDAKYRLLPNRVVYPTMIVAAVFWVVISVSNGTITDTEHWLGLAAAMLPIAGVYGLIYLITRGRAIGLGDVKLGVVIGFLLPWSAATIVLFAANILAMITIVIMSIAETTGKKKKFKLITKIPFGPFLIIATILVFLLSKMVVWYR